MKYIAGRGGDSSGGAQRAAVEDPNSARSKSYAKIVDLLGEGQWEEVLVGGLRGFYLNDVQAMNDDGTMNIEGLTVETRDGSLTQIRMEIAETVESTNAVGLEMKQNLPVEKVVFGTSIDALRVVIAVPRLTSQNASTGDLNGATVQYRIEYKSNDNPLWRLVPTNAVTSSWQNLTFGNPQTGFSRYRLNYTITPARWWDEDEYNVPCVYQLQYTLTNGAQWIDAKKDVATAPLSEEFIVDVSQSDTVNFRIVVQDSPTFIPKGTLIASASEQILFAEGGNYDEDEGIQTISDKTNSAYERETLFRVRGESPFTVRCTRVTPDSESEALQNKTVFQSVSTVTEEKFVYPGSVLVGTSVDATQFSSIPNRAFLCKMLRVKVPGNYDPITREYNGFWGGDFKVAWTDNPAWCFYDLITNKRYGLGERVPEEFVDKAALYQIAQYCDEYVPDGNGGYEPRFTCNLYLQNQMEAYKVISDMATIFRGITYWASGNIVPVQDSEKEPVYAFNNTNVLDGMFNYQSSDVNTRYNAVTVTWNDPNNMYRQASEYVPDDDAIAALGYINPTSVVAFGCTSKGMARRVGKWLLYTNTYETDAVTFSTGIEGAIPMPGDVIKITDSLRSLDRRGGRVVSSTLNDVTLDMSVEFIGGTTYTLSFIDVDGGLVDGYYTPVSTVTTDTVTFTTALTKAIAKDSVYVLADDSAEPQLFRVIAIKEEDKGKYTISGVSYNPSKYAYVEKDERLTAVAGPDTYVAGVSDLVTSEILYADGVAIKSKLRLDWKAPAKAVAYQVYVIAPDGTRFSSDRQQATFYEVAETLPGVYEVAITALDVIGNKSVKTSVSVDVYGKTAPPVAPVNLAVKSFSGAGTITWDLHPDLDVRVGGSVVIKHTTKTSGVQWEDGVVVAVASGASTQASIPLMSGTYTAKAIDEGGRYSSSFTSALSAFAEVSATNVLATLTEHPTFSGAKDNLFVEGGLLTLYGEMEWDDVVSVDDLESIDYLGTGNLTGRYEFGDVIDLLGTYTVRAFGNVEGFATAANDTMGSRITPIGTWTRFGGDIINDASIRLYISTTTDDPNSPSAVWGEWAEFILADYTARGFKFKLEMSIASDQHLLYVQNLSVSVDAVDRVLGEDNVSVGTGGFSVVFNGAFAATPAVAISIDGMQNGDYYEFSNKTANGFTVVIKNGGTAVARQIDWLAKGYGRKI